MADGRGGPRTVFGRGGVEPSEWEDDSFEDYAFDDGFDEDSRHGGMHAWTMALELGTRGADGDPRKMTTRQLGTLGEDLAELYLKQRGYHVLERNMRNRGGEADIVARQGRCVVMVEVKTRLADSEGDDVMPEIAVDKRKQERYRKIALEYLVENPDESLVRFDVIAIKVRAARDATVRHLSGAFVCDL
ncbi:YraN family protein [Olsenella profusa]|mgnify:FL=1|uniref:UPF0102 protein HMPREF1316_0261 n=1 Tax=Olsenella profusa F0195 TaxID=1125712 RepID=U2V6G9_9ACTN|nr:YraN family protein [Olsenella profusa]ERL08231.1 TIGR00252 family protein [Olsenella profusa F0195]